MTDGEHENRDGGVRISVDAPSVEAIADAFDLEPAAAGDGAPFPEELLPVVSLLEDVYGGVAEATAEDDRGRSRKIVREYAGREDVDSDGVGHVLRVLEASGLVVQDGNRWRLADAE